MINSRRAKRRAGCTIWLALAISMLAGSACRSPQKADSDTPAADAEIELAPMPIGERGGAQLWGDNCARCHNSRTPSGFSDAQWEVIAHHMRVRANLTAYEHEKILQFLKLGN